jgi:hypothetical protein
MGTSPPWRKRAVSDAVTLNVAVAAIDLKSVIAVVSPKVAGGREGEGVGVIERVEIPAD